MATPERYVCPSASAEYTICNIAIADYNSPHSYFRRIGGNSRYSKIIHFWVSSLLFAAHSFPTPTNPPSPGLCIFHGNPVSLLHLYFAQVADDHALAATRGGMEFDEMPPGDSSSGNVFGYILLLIVLIALNAFFAMSELAIVSLNDNKIRKTALEGDKKAGKLLRLIENPTSFLSTIQLGVTLSGFLASAVAADTFAEMFVQSLGPRLPISPGVLRVISLVVITLLLSFVTLVFGELVPKRVAMQNYEKISFAVAGILNGLMTALKPLVWLLSASTNGVLRLLGINPDDEPEEITEEEIRMMIDVGNEKGHIEESDREMLNNIFEFDDRTVEEIMTHRTEVVALEVDSPLSKIIQTALDTGYSRIPVYEGDLDDVVGILYVKDLLAFVLQNPPSFNLRDFMREPLYVIESTSCKALLAQFQEKKIQMAVVVDEYGGTAGLVSMEDLLESIVGNIQDEYDDEEEEIIPLGETTAIVDGLTPIETVFRYFDLGDVPEEDDFDTIGGYILSKLGSIPGEDEHPSVEVKNIRFTVQEMDERRIAKLYEERLPEPEPVEPEEEPKGKIRGRDKDSDSDEG